MIKEEIAIMKKLNHNNLVSLIEVLDDPAEDSLYMVMEMCKKGVVMKVGLEDRADPYEDERCRCWFRDLILGIEYLHAQGIVHRDIKPDNCLVTNDDVLKVVDFGVSEMFAKDSDMFTAKSAGSPAFLPPELCVVKHGDVSGKATDIWSMGVTLYCLRYGKLPFERGSIFELFDAIRGDDVVCEGETDARFQDLMLRILEKDPAKRIEMSELRVSTILARSIAPHGLHGIPGTLVGDEGWPRSPVAGKREHCSNCSTSNRGRNELGHHADCWTHSRCGESVLFHVILIIDKLTYSQIKAVKKFKRLLNRKKEEAPMQSILGQDYEAHFVEAPLEMEPEEDFSISENIALANKSHSLDTYNRVSSERLNVLRGYHQCRDDLGHDQSVEIANTNPGGTDSSSIRRTPKIPGESDDLQNSWTPPALSRTDSAATKRSVEGTRGHARDPLEEDFPYLFIGPSTYTGSSSYDVDMSDSQPFILEKPGNTLVSETFDVHMTEDEDSSALTVSESPGAADFDIYETAYRRQIEQICDRSIPHRGTVPKMYLTRRVDGKDEVKRLIQEQETAEDQKPTSKTAPAIGDKVAVPSSSSFSSAVGMIRAQLEDQKQPEQQQQQQQSLPQGQPPEVTAPAPAPAPSQPPAPQSEQAMTEPPMPATTNKENQPSPPENNRAKLRCLLGRVRGN